MEADSYARPELLAEPEWLVTVQDDPNVCIVDCSAGHGQKWAYIPNAVTLPVHFSLKDPDDPMHVVRGEQFAALMEQIGVSDDTTVVAYDRHGGMAAARLWWVLTYYGHRDSRLLNGGWHRWRAEGRPIVAKPSQRERGRFTPHRNKAVLATLDYLRKRVDDPDVQILDVRNPSESQGHNPWGNRRDGRIIGAIAWEWVHSLSEDISRRFRPAGELNAELAALGLSPEKEVVVHCQAGIRASHSSFVLSLLGYPRVRNYEASMREWANLPDTPMMNGHRSGE